MSYGRLHECQFYERILSLTLERQFFPVSLRRSHRLTNSKRHVTRPSTFPFETSCQNSVLFSFDFLRFLLLFYLIKVSFTCLRVSFFVITTSFGILSRNLNTRMTMVCKVELGSRDDVKSSLQRHLVEFRNRNTHSDCKPFPWYCWRGTRVSSDVPLSYGVFLSYFLSRQKSRTSPNHTRKRPLPPSKENRKTSWSREILRFPSISG